MSLETTGPCGLWLHWVFLQSIGRGAAQPLWCCLNNKDWCVGTPLMILQSVNMSGLVHLCKKSDWIYTFGMFCLHLTLQLGALVYKKCTFSTFLACLSHTINAVFMSLLNSELRTLCYSLNKQNTMAGCKWASLYMWAGLLFSPSFIHPVGL